MRGTRRGTAALLCGAVLAGLLGIAYLAGRGGIGREPSEIALVNKAEGVEIAVKGGSVTPTGLELVLRDATGSDEVWYGYGAWYRLEENIRGEWYPVQPQPGAVEGYDDWLRPIPKETERQNGDLQGEEYDWAYYYGQLPPGEYRIVIVAEEISAEDPGERPLGELVRDQFYLAAEFRVE